MAFDSLEMSLKGYSSSMRSAPHKHNTAHTLLYSSSMGSARAHAHTLWHARPPPPIFARLACRHSAAAAQRLPTALSSVPCAALLANVHGAGPLGLPPISTCNGVLLCAVPRVDTAPTSRARRA